MKARKFNFDEDDPAKDNEALRVAIETKLNRMASQAAKLDAAEKRWLRKKRLANTKLKTITRSKRALRRRRATFAKTLKGT